MAMVLWTPGWATEEDSTAQTVSADPANDTLTLAPVRIEGRAFSLVGVADNATEGFVGQEQLKKRPLMRVGELLETVPGFIATQHSGAGKGNQMFVRGFNLDHGTDFATHLEGMPINLPTHAHGQGYSDLNFIIPELIGHLHFRKGPYYADQGDFGAAGSARFRYVDRLDPGLIEVAAGSDDFRRALLAYSREIGQGDVLAGFEFFQHDGPWTNPDDFDKFNGVLRYTRLNRDQRFSLMAMGYIGDWNATDQIPLRAVEDGRLGRFDAVDPSDGGESHRVSLSAEWMSGGADRGFEISAYAAAYRLELFSNFTFFLDDPVNGDQFEQFDKRRFFGSNFQRHLTMEPAGFDTKLRYGLETRFDDIDTVGLFRTRERERLSTISDDTVEQWSLAALAELETRWKPWLRSVAGVRIDHFSFDVRSNDPRNSGDRSDTIAAPSLRLVFGPWSETELYLSTGRGFHSNDARGTLRTIDPNDGEPTGRVDPLVPATGVELGIRSNMISGLETSLSLFMLQLDSELVFVGDEGTTEPNRATRRFGVEWANFWRPTSWLTADFDIALTRARFREDLGEGRRIPNSVDRVVAAGVTVDSLPGAWRPFSGAIRLRHFSTYPLTEDNSERADSTTLVNLDLGWAFNDALALRLGVFNLFDAKDNDIEFFETARLSGEPAEGVEGVLFHPVLPRQFRARLVWRFD